MILRKKIIIGFLIAIACLILGCSMAGVKNNYDKSGPIKRITTPSSYKRTKIRVENIQPPAEIPLEEGKEDKSILIKVGDKEYVVITKGKKYIITIKENIITVKEKD